MIFIALVLFIIAAIFGLLNLIAILSDKSTSGPIVLMHGMAALFAVFALIAYTMGHMNKLLVTSIVLFVLAALGGLFLLTIDMSNKPVPKKIALMHPLVAIAGLVVLLVYLYQTFGG